MPDFRETQLEKSGQNWKNASFPGLWGEIFKNQGRLINFEHKIIVKLDNPNRLDNDQEVIFMFKISVWRDPRMLSLSLSLFSDQFKIKEKNTDKK